MRKIKVKLTKDLEVENEELDVFVYTFVRPYDD